MESCRPQQISHIHQTLAIQLQSFYGGSSDWRNTNYERVVLVPAKMVPPIVFARMEQGYAFTTYRVHSRGLIVFATVTSSASVCQIFRPCFSPETLRKNMFHLERLRSILPQALASFGNTRTGDGLGLQYAGALRGSASFQTSAEGFIPSCCIRVSRGTDRKRANSIRDANLFTSCSSIRSLMARSS